MTKSSRNTANVKIAHIHLSVEINEDPSWNWSSPKVESRVDFSLPVEMFDEKRFGALVLKTINEGLEKFPEAVLEYEAEAAKKEAAKKETEGVESL